MSKPVHISTVIEWGKPFGVVPKGRVGAGRTWQYLFVATTSRGRAIARSAKSIAVNHGMVTGNDFYQFKIFFEQQQWLW